MGSEMCIRDSFCNVSSSKKWQKRKKKTYTEKVRFMNPIFLSFRLAAGQASPSAGIKLHAPHAAQRCRGVSKNSAAMCLCIVAHAFFSCSLWLCHKQRAAASRAANQRAAGADTTAAKARGSGMRIVERVSRCVPDRDI